MLELLTFFWLLATALEPPVEQFDRLMTQVRDGLVERETARRELRDLVVTLGTDGRSRCEPSPPGPWVFPLEGYGPEAIGGTHGEGYRPQGYEFFDGNRHKGHPAHDLFIRDVNQDSRDDKTGLPVRVASVSGGLVVSLNDAWQSGSAIRGGRYVYVFEPATRRFYYYAHLEAVAVQLGDCVTPGSILGTVGRTGAAAAQKRSPTHVHFMMLELRDGVPEARDSYMQLLKARPWR